MPPKRKSDTEGTSSKPSSRAAASKPASAASKASKPPSGASKPPKSAQSPEPAPKKAKFTKEDPGMTAKQFTDSAKELEIALGDISKLTAEPTTFSTGSYGWKASGKVRIKVTVDGEEKEVAVMASCNLTVSGSRPDKKTPNGSKRGRPRKNPSPDEEE